MPERTSRASWNGDLKNGNGEMSLGSGAYTGAFSFASRFEDGEGTNPEELIAAAHAGCYSMALSNALGEEGYTPENVSTEATVNFNPDELEIDRIVLTTEAEVPEIDEETFLEVANEAKEGCPVSKALAGTEISLDATLL